MISVVAPIYNEEEIITLLHDSIADAMENVDEKWEVVYVNDGSKDSSLELLRNLQATDPRIVVVELSRNWGHMGALWAGMQTARGDAVILMDGDLQDPPEVLPELVQAWRNGAQVVSAVRRSRKESRKLLAFLFPLFHHLLGKLSDYPIPLNSGIFGLLDRQALDSINSLQECNRYLPGLRAWVGYRTAIVPYDRNDRAGGEGKLTFLSRIKYAMDAITSFSYKPLRVSFVLSSLAVIFSIVLAILAAVSTAHRWTCSALWLRYSLSADFYCCVSGLSVNTWAAFTMRCGVARFHSLTTCIGRDGAVCTADHQAASHAGGVNGNAEKIYPAA